MITRTIHYYDGKDTHTISVIYQDCPKIHIWTDPGIYGSHDLGEAIARSISGLFRDIISEYPIILHVISKIILFIPFILLGVAYATLLERKVLASIQGRKGPNVVGIFGLLQPMADGLKLLVKEFNVPRQSDRILFVYAPALTFCISLMGWGVVPFGPHIALSYIDLGALYIFAISSLGVYGTLVAGWSSFSKYALLGSLRSAAQMISYEVSLGLICMPAFLFAGSLSLGDIISSQATVWFIHPCLSLAILFFGSSLAETNRAPFDLPEAEAELVAGYNVEYGGMAFALFFLGEYANILLMGVFGSILFLGGWHITTPFITDFFGIVVAQGYVYGLKIAFIVFLFILIRGVLPRYRYDQLMLLGWKAFLPQALACILFFGAAGYIFDAFPR